MIPLPWRGSSDCLYMEEKRKENHQHAKVHGPNQQHGEVHGINQQYAEVREQPRF